VELDFELIASGDSRARLGESPFWDPENGDIWWVDIDGRSLFRREAETGRVDCWATPEIPGFVVLTGMNCPAVGMETGIYSFDAARDEWTVLVSLDRPGHRFNDAAVDPQGRLWTSTMSLDVEFGCGEVQAATEDLALKPVVGGLTIPNGLAVDLERGRFFCSDSHPDVQTIWIRQIDPDTLDLGEASVFAGTKHLAGRPDGAALDGRGFYWIAGVDGSQVYVFNLAGRLCSSIPVPFPAPTKVSFFGAGGRSVAVTSKDMGENGGQLAFADLPDAFVGGVTQPYWRSGK